MNLSAPDKTVICACQRLILHGDRLKEVGCDKSGSLL